MGCNVVGRRRARSSSLMEETLYGPRHTSGLAASNEGEQAGIRRRANQRLLLSHGPAGKTYWSTPYLRSLRRDGHVFGYQTTDVMANVCVWASLLRKGEQFSQTAMDGQSRRWRKQVEEGMWAVLRRNLLVKREASAAAAAASSCGLWKAPHVSQCCNWDCGVACVQMVLRGLGREGERSSLLAALGTRSVWTIDLAMLLHRFGVRFMYCTRTAGVTEAYSTVDFYRANFDRDALRVQALFKAADEAKVGAVQKAFSWKELSVLLSGYDYAAIVLVDSRHLQPAGRRTPSVSPSRALSLSPPSPSTTERDSPTFSTPKRRREDAGEGSGGRSSNAVEGKEDEENESGAPCRRRRRRRSKGYVDVHLGQRGAASGLMVHASAGRATPPSPIIASESAGEDADGGPYEFRNLCVSPAPHAVDGDGMTMSPFMTPPAPRLRRKTPGEVGEYWGEDCSRGATGSASNPSDSSSPSPSCATVSPPCSPVLKSPRNVNAETSGPGASPESSYCGHYILLVGWSEADGVFIARDPALPFSNASPRAATASFTAGVGGGAGNNSVADDPNAHVCLALTPEALDRARRSYGTDEDVLVIDLARSKKGGVAAAPLAAAAAATALAASAASSAAAASALVGLFAMAAAAAAATAEPSGFKEWAWPDPSAWFGGQTSVGVDNAADAANEKVGTDANSTRGNRGGSSSGGTTTAASRVREAVEGLTQGGAEAAARRLASLLSYAPIGWRFSIVGDGSRGLRTGSGATSDAETDEGERWAARVVSAVEGLLQGGANTMEGLLEGGRRAAYTMEGLLEGGRRAAYSLRDSLADVADAPGGAGAECCASMARDAPGSTISPGVGTVMSTA